MSPLLHVLSVLLPSLFCFLYFFRCLTGSKNGRKLPPGPRGLPIIGNLHMLGNLPHQSLYHLGKKYGDIMLMRLGSVPTVVVTSARAAKLFLKTHDTIFASRPITQASTVMSYGAKGIAFTSYGPYWRDARKLCTLKLLSSSKVEYFAWMRKEVLGMAVESIKKVAAAGEVMDFSMMVQNLLQDMTYRMVFGQECKDLDTSLIKESLFLSGAFNIADYVPFLGLFDLQGLTFRMKAFTKEMDKFLEKIIDDHIQESQSKRKQQKDFIDVLLSIMNHPMNPQDDSSDIITRTHIKAIILDMVVASFDTTSNTIEWTIAELLRHPIVMKNLREELDIVIGKKRMVEEDDLPKLTYLDMIIKETLRLHPVGPLLIPHESMEDVTIDGYFIPKKSRLIVNAWAIGRDINTWTSSLHNVESFFPERFKDINVDILGQDFQLLPFGSGRRGCPGLRLGLVTVKIVLAQLLHCFNWELPKGVSPDDLDMTEKFGLTMERCCHVLVMPTYSLTC